MSVRTSSCIILRVCCPQYLYQHPYSGVEDYLCNKLNELPEPAIEQYLLQYVYLAASRPGSALERTIIGLCSKSFVIAIKVGQGPLLCPQSTSC